MSEKYPLWYGQGRMQGCVLLLIKQMKLENADQPAACKVLDEMERRVRELRASVVQAMVEKRFAELEIGESVENGSGAYNVQ